MEIHDIWEGTGCGEVGGEEVSYEEFRIGLVEWLRIHGPVRPVGRAVGRSRWRFL